MVLAARELVPVLVVVLLFVLVLVVRLLAADRVGLEVVVRTDLVNFNGTTYNFEPNAVCREKANNKDKDKEKDNNKDGNKLPRCKDHDSGDDDSGDSED